MKPRYLLLSGLLITVILGGCSYYQQAASGHLSLMAKRRPISVVIADPKTDDMTRARLQSALKLRRFAVHALMLPDNKSYTTYADTGRKAVVYNVFAAPEFSLKPKIWCFPIAGCVAYRGYFALKDARKLGAQLRTQGLDVSISGASAYSTLGWYADPLLNTMLAGSDTALADTLFHELAHQLIYVKNDTRFNESFASFIAMEGVRRWLLTQDDPKAYLRYLARASHRRDFLALLQTTRAQLAALYARNMPDEEKRAHKQRIFEQLHAEYMVRRRTWGPGRHYDDWFASPLNNARFVAIGSYTDDIPFFRALLDRHHGDLKSFYEAVRSLARLGPTTRRKQMQKLLSSAPDAS